MRSIYIVRCADDTLYTGIAKDLDKRISDHNISKVGAKYTKSRRPVVCVWSMRVRDRVVAAKLEFQIKRLGREKKEELVVSGKRFKK